MEIVQPIPTRAKIARAWLEHAHSFDRCVTLATSKAGLAGTVRKSRTSGLSTHAQKFETRVVVNGYKNGPSLRLR